MRIICYAQAEKQKSRNVLAAFAEGAGGKMASTSASSLEPGAAAFYGVRPAWAHLWEQAKAEGRVWFYLDNAWLDAAREHYFRIGVNAVQSWSGARSDGARLAALGVRVMPWRSGRHVVIAHSSDEFMRCVAGWPGGALAWESEVIWKLRRHTDRPVISRTKRTARPLANDLANAHALVAHSSVSAIEALVAGVPVIVTDPGSAAAGFAMSFEQVEEPPYPAGREQFVARLADSQWTLAELRAGAGHFLGRE
jgi:hypothetical protein